MLLWLSIQGLALVDSVELAFARGLNVLTGETGAGKSLILGSVGLLLGDRADAAWLRAGETRGAVEGTFDLSGRPDLQDALRAIDVEPEPDQERVVLRREIGADGKSRAFINGRGVLLAQLRAAGDLLVDLHGQHEHQHLLDPVRQTDFFDAWAETWEERRALEAERAQILDDRRRLRAARDAMERDRAEEETLRADGAELDAAALAPGEEEALLRDRERLAYRERILAGLTEALTYAADEETGAEARLRRAVKALRVGATLDPGLEGLAAESEALFEALASLDARVESERDRLLEEPLDIERVEERLDRIHRLKRKHRTDYDGLLTLAEVLRARVRALEPESAELSRQERALEARIRAYDRRLDLLAERRAARSAAFGRAAGALLTRLGFGKAALRVVPAAAGGGDRSRHVIDPAPIPALEFEFQPNPGEPPRPLRRIASGGELSRVMLAVKSLMADRDRVAVLVFDEVDQGIGGAVGEEVGRLLRDLGSKRQVLCITHLPLIAAYAERQLHVAKSTAEGRTATRVTTLSERERVDEIARLLAGARASETTRRQARELLRGAGGEKGADVSSSDAAEKPARRRVARGKR